MISFLLSFILVVNNRYFINFILLMITSLLVHGILSINYIEKSKLLFNGYSNYDSLTTSIIIISALITLWLISLYGESLMYLKLKLNNEYTALILLLLISLGGLVAVNHYLNLFVAIELQSLSLYILFATTVTPTLFKNNSKVSLSYLINAATTTALLLFGLAINSSVLILITMIWKLGVLPLHAWSLPILDNVHNLTTSIYLTLTKYGTLLVIGFISSTNYIATKLLTYIGLLNLSVGNILGLLQIRYQRIIVYSSLIQIGYMLLALANQTSLGLGYFEMYSFYTVMLLILWIVPTYNKWNSGRLLPAVYLGVLILVLYTVAGLPFFPLFWTKLDILYFIQSQSLVLALLGTLLSSLIYIRLIKYMAFFQYNQWC